MLFLLTELADLNFLLPLGSKLRQHLFAERVLDALDIRALSQMDSVELAPCGADAAAETLVRVNDRGSAA